MKNRVRSWKRSHTDVQISSQPGIEFTVMRVEDKNLANRGAMILTIKYVVSAFYLSIWTKWAKKIQQLKAGQF